MNPLPPLADMSTTNNDEFREEHFLETKVRFTSFNRCNVMFEFFFPASLTEGKRLIDGERADS